MDKYLGKRLDGRYEMRELIGVGGMAYVYKAYDAVDDRIVAVKILKDEFLNSDEFVRRFRNESKAIAILNHPNIVKVLDVGFGERLQYIVMEYIDGITLKEYLDQRKDIRWKEAVHFTVQILRALQHAHDKGIVHRDIKPQNIMLLSDGTIKVTDFGIARLTRSDMKATVEGNKAIGSVHYISPEQARGEITDEKTDLYAVGIMLYEMLTGCLPFEADNAVSVAIMQMQSEAKVPHLINPEIPEGLEQITLKAMQKDTAKRYQSAAEMLSDFDEFKKNPSIKFEYTYMTDDTPTRYVDAITRVRGDGAETTVKTNKDEPAKTQKKVKKNNTKTIILIVVLCLVIGLFAVLIGWLVSNWSNLFSKKADEVVVDKFIGMMYYTDVEGNLEYSQKYDLKIKWEDANNPDVKKGEVYKQEPAYGKTVKKGATVTLYVNMATPKDITLDVRAEIEGAHKNDVRKLLQDAGFVVNEIISSSDTVEADHVISVNINKGQTYPYGTNVTMVVSTGPSKLPPIEFPSIIIGENQTMAAETLKSYGFVGKIVYQPTNYTDEAFAQSGTIMGVIENGVLLDTVPTEISADGLLTLAVSNGMKNVTIELDWPDFQHLLDVRVIVGSSLDSELGSKYVGYMPAAGSKMAFALGTHPSAEDYQVMVQIKKHDAPNSDYKTYATLTIHPVDGTWTMVGDYQHLPGITPVAALPSNITVGNTLSYDALMSAFQSKGFKNVTVQDHITGEVVLSGDALTITDIHCDATGEELPLNTNITIKVGVETAVPDVLIPALIFSEPSSYETLVNDHLNAFVVLSVKDELGNDVLEGDGWVVVMIVCDGTEITESNLNENSTWPEGTTIELVVKTISVEG